MFKEFTITIKGVPDEGVSRRFWEEIDSPYYSFMRLHAHAIIHGEAPRETIDWLVLECKKFGLEVIEVAK